MRKILLVAVLLLLLAGCAGVTPAPDEGGYPNPKAISAFALQPECLVVEKGGGMVCLYKPGQARVFVNGECLELKSGDTMCWHRPAP